MKARKAADQEEIARLADIHFEHERMRLERENVRQLRAAAQKRDASETQSQHHG